MKTKIKFLIGLLITAISFTIVSVSLGRLEVRASSAAKLTQRYELYTEAAWNGYQAELEKLSGWNTDIQAMLDATTGWASRGANAKPTLVQNAAGYLEFPNATGYTKFLEKCSNGDMFWDDAANYGPINDTTLTLSYKDYYGKNSLTDMFDADGKFICSPSKPTQLSGNVSNGDKLVVATYITTNEEILMYQIGPNLHNFATNVSNTNFYPDGDGWNPVNQGKQTSGTNEFYIYGGVHVKGDNSDKIQFDDYLALATTFEVSASAGTYTIDKPIFGASSSDARTKMKAIGVSADIDAHSNPSNFEWNSVQFTVGSGLKSTTDIDIKSIVDSNGTTKTATSTTAISGVNYTVDGFKPSTTTPSYTNKVSINFDVLDKGKVTGIDIDDGTGSGYTAFDATVYILTGNTVPNIPVPTAGNDVLVKFNMQAEDGTTIEKVVRISAEPKLENLAIETDVDGTNTSLVTTSRFYRTADTSNHTFDSDVLNYTIEVPYNSSSSKAIKVTPTATARQTITVAGNTVTTGATSTYTLAAGLSGDQTFSVIVKGENGTSTKTYNITVKLKNSDTTATLQLKLPDGTIVPFSSSTATGVDFEKSIGPTINSFDVIATAGSSTSTIKIGTTNPATNSVTSGTPYAISGTDVPAQDQTKTYYITVTSEAGTTKTYTFTVKKEKANTDASLTSIVFKDMSGTTYSHTTSADGLTFTVDKFKASDLKFQFIPTFNTKSTGTMGSITLLNGGGAPTNVVDISSNYSTTEVNGSISFTITPESGSTDAITYTINYSRAAAKVDKDVTVELYYNASDPAPFATHTYSATDTSWTYTTGTGSGKLNYDVSSVIAKVKYTAANNLVVKDSATSTTTYGDGGTIYTAPFGAPSTSATANTKSKTFYVQSEYDKLTGATGLTYELKLERDAVNDSYKYFTIQYYYEDAEGNLVYNGGTTPFSMVADTTNDNYNSLPSSATNAIPFGVKKIYYTITRGTGTTAVASTTDIKVGGTSIIGIQQEIDVSTLTNIYANPIVVSHTATTQLTNHTINLRFHRVAAETGKSVGIKVFGRTTTAEYTKDPTPSSISFTYQVAYASDNQIYLDITKASNSEKAKIYLTTSTSNPHQYVYDPDNPEYFNVPTTSSATPTVVYVVVEAEDGSSDTITLTIKAQDTRSTDSTIDDVEFLDASGASYDMKLDDGSSTSFSFASHHDLTALRVPYSVSSLIVKVTTHDNKATLSLPSSGVSTDTSNTAIHKFTLTLSNTGTTANTFQVRAKAENGSLSTTTYNFKIFRDQAATGNYLKNVKINGNSVNDAYFTTNTSLEDNFKGTGGALLTSMPMSFDVSDGATWTATDFFTSTSTGNVNFTNNKATFKITVTSEDLNSRTYTFNFYSANEDFTLDDIKLYKDSTGTAMTYETGSSFTYASGTTSYTLQVPYSNSTASVLASINTANAKGQAIYIDGTKLSVIDPFTSAISASKDYASLAISPAKTTIKVKVKSQYAELNPAITNQEKEYTIDITRTAADTDSTLSNLEVKVIGTTTVDMGTFTPSKTTGYKLEEVDGSSATFVAKPNSPKAKVTFATFASTNPGDQISGSYPLTITAAGSHNETLVFTVTAEDGSVTKYEVLVSLDKITLESITTIDKIETYAKSDASTDLMTGTNAFSTTKTSGYNITIPGTETEVKLTVTPQANSATITFNGLPASSKGVASKNFAIAEGATVTIKVSSNAEDGTANSSVYEIVVTRPKMDTNNELDVLTIDSNPLPDPYKIHLPYGTTSVSIGASPKKSTSQVSGDLGTQPLSGYENTFVVTVTAEDGTPKNYPVTVYVDEPTSLATLSAIDTANTNHTADFTPTKYTYTGTVPYDVTGVEISLTTTGNLANGLTCLLEGSPLPASKKANFSLQPGDNKFEVLLYTETDPTGSTYEIKIKRELGNSDNYILKYIKAGTDGNLIASDWNPVADTYQYFVDRSVSTAKFVPITETALAGGKELNGNTDGYTLQLSDGAKIKSVTPASQLLQVGANVFTVEVESQNGATKQYKFTIIRADLDFDIKDIEIKESATGSDVLDLSNAAFDYDPNTFTYTFNVPYTTDKAYLKVTPNSNLATVEADLTGSSLWQTYSNSLQSIGLGTTNIKIRAKAEVQTHYSAGTFISPEYTISIVRSLPNSDATLKQLKAVVTKANGDKQDLIASFDPATKTYTIENLDTLVEPNISAVEIVGVANATTTKVEGILSEYKSVEALQAFSGAGVDVSGYVFKFNVKTEAEDGTKDEYTIKDLHNVLGITVVDSNGNKYLGKDTGYKEQFDASIMTYEYEIPYPTQSVTIDIEKDPYEPSTKNGTGQFNIPTDIALGAEKEFEVFLTSQKGNNSEKYKVKIKVAKPSSDATLSEFKINNVLVTKLNPTTGKQEFLPDEENYIFSVTIPNNDPEITISGVATDSKAKLDISSTGDSSGSTKKKLVPGNNSVSITVTAEDGTQKTYSAIVKLDFPDAKLEDLTVADYQLYKDSNLVDANKIEFKDPEVAQDEIKDFYLLVPNSVTSAPITIEVPDDSYQTTCTNSSQNPTGLIRQFTDLQFNEGDNDFTIEATSGDGKKIQYRVHVKRLGREATATDIGLVSITPWDANEKDVTTEVDKYLENNDYDVNDKKDNISLFDTALFDSNVIHEYTVPNKVVNLDITATPGVGLIAGTDKRQTVQVVGEKGLKVGENVVTIVVTSADGTNQRAVVLKINRLPMEYKVEEYDGSKTIEYLGEETSTKDGSVMRTYQIDLGDTKIDNTDKTKEMFMDYIQYDRKQNNISTEIISDLTDPNLKEVLVKVTDGDISDIVAFKIYEQKLKYSVEEYDGSSAIEFKTSKSFDDGSKNQVYTVSLKEADRTALKDDDESKALFTDYIKYDKNDKTIKAEVISDLDDKNLTEVTVRVSNGKQTDLVTFKLDGATLASNSGFTSLLKTWWPLFVGIIVSIILLILILIAVNKDKYGKINKNRKHSD